MAMAPQFSNAQRLLAAELALNGREPEAREVLDRVAEGLRKAGMPQE